MTNGSNKCCNFSLTYKKEDPLGVSIHLWQAPVYMSAPSVVKFKSICPGACAPSTNVRMPRSFANAQISSTGNRRPVELVMWLMKMRFVLSVIP